MFQYGKGFIEMFQLICLTDISEGNYNIKENVYDHSCRRHTENIKQIFLLRGN